MIDLLLALFERPIYHRALIRQRHNIATRASASTVARLLRCSILVGRDRGATLPIVVLVAPPPSCNIVSSRYPVGINLRRIRLPNQSPHNVVLIILRLIAAGAPRMI